MEKQHPDLLDDVESISKMQLDELLTTFYQLKWLSVEHYDSDIKNSANKQLSVVVREFHKRCK